MSTVSSSLQCIPIGCGGAAARMSPCLELVLALCWCWCCGRPTEPEPSINWVQLSGVTLGVELWRDGVTCASITTNCHN